MITPCEFSTNTKKGKIKNVPTSDRIVTETTTVVDLKQVAFQWRTFDAHDCISTTW